MSRIFLGLDGGQSGTTVLIGDETGKVLGMGRAGPCNHTRAAEGHKKFVSAVSGALTAAIEHAGVEDAMFEAACLGFSGGFEDKEMLAMELVQAGSYRFAHDAQIALTGATAGAPGVIAIAGTGSIAFGANSAGKTARVGGWGYLFGDEGGALDIVRQAVRAALRHEEGWGPPTSLLPALTRETGAGNANELLHRFYTQEYPRDRIAALAPLVDDAARANDPVAKSIVLGAAQNLAMLVAAVRGQLFAPGDAPVISYTGGVFRSGMILERFRTLVELEEGNRVQPPLHGPAAGALIEAYRMAGIECALKGAPEEK